MDNMESIGNLVDLAFKSNLLSDEEREHGVSPSRLSEITQKFETFAKSLGIPWNPEDFRKELEQQIQIRIVDKGSCLSVDEHARNRNWLKDRKKDDWIFWKECKKSLMGTLPLKVQQAMDRDTDAILEHMGDPQKTELATKGLVIGDVQSGKTSNYTGLICKAADVGYKVIIVTTGILENLRRQTQERLERDFVKVKTEGNSLEFSAAQDTKVNSMTSCRSDFLKATRWGAINAGDHPYLFVVKKNVNVLTALYKHLQKNASHYEKKPLLFIDDEADNASIDTNEPDPDVEPTKTNGSIREILKLFTRSSYVGYTATPYANIFIDPSVTKMGTQDLFPSDFIYCLSVSSDYVGAEKLFGLGNEEQDDIDAPAEQNDNVNVCTIGDSGEETAFLEGLEKSRKSLSPPASLVSALYTFILARAVHQVRGRGKQHCGMLVHVSQRQHIQKKVEKIVDRLLEHVKEQLRCHGCEPGAFQENETLCRVRQTWAEQYEGKIPEHWEDVQGLLVDETFLERFTLFLVNSTTSKRINKELESFDYSKYPDGLTSIVVGGNCLSRGLTIEGLTVTYFLRRSRQYDTLMQMGRWFGYRKGYEDLCRIFIDRNTQDYFSQIALASKELKQSINDMNRKRMSPLTFGLRVRNGVGGISITSRNKMRNARESISGEDVDMTLHLVETYAIPEAKKSLEHNNEALREFVRLLDDKYGRYERKKNEVPAHDGILFWKSVSTDDVLAYLRGLQGMHWSAEEYVWADEALRNYLEGFDDMDVTLISLNPNKASSNLQRVILHTGERIYPLRRNPSVNRLGVGEIVFNKNHVFSKSDERGCITSDEEKLLLERCGVDRLQEVPPMEYRTLEGRKPLLMLAFVLLPEEHLNVTRLVRGYDAKLTKLVSVYGVSCPGEGKVRSTTSLGTVYVQNPVGNHLEETQDLEAQDSEDDDSDE